MAQMVVNGWSRSDWDDDVKFAEWVTDYLPKPLYDDAVERMKTNGLHAKMSVKWDPFFRIELEPLEEWTWLCAPDKVEAYFKTSWRPHVTLANWGWSWSDFSLVFDKYDGNEAVIKIHHVGAGGTAVLAYEGLGADWDLWRVYIDGDQGYKWTENSFGLHISM